MKIGIEFNIFSSGYCRYGDDRYKKLKEHGFSCINFNMSNTNTELYTSPEADELLLSEKFLADAAGVEINQAHGPWRSPPRDKTPEDRVERMDKMKKSIRFTSLLGCKNWVIHPLMPLGAGHVSVFADDSDGSYIGILWWHGAMQPMCTAETNVNQ